MQSATTADAATRTRNPHPHQNLTQAMPTPCTSPAPSYLTRNPSSGARIEASPAYLTQDPPRQRKPWSICDPVGMPPRRFGVGQQFRGVISGAETASRLGISPGRLRACAASLGLEVFAYGPNNAAFYWEKHVEAVRAARAS